MQIINDFDSLINDLPLSKEEKKKVAEAIDTKAIEKAHDELLPNIYAKTILIIFGVINISVIGIVVAGFLVDSGIFGSPKSSERFITSNVLMALITGVTIQVSYATRTIGNFFFKTQKNMLSHTN